MKKGFTLIKLMVAITSTAVLIALLLPDIQKAKDVALKGTQNKGPFWVYREYEYAGGPVTSETSGAYKHSLQEILDMYEINLKEEQLKYSLELKADAQQETNPLDNSTNSVEGVSTPLSSTPDLEVNPADELNPPSTAPSKKAITRRTKRAIKNLKIELSQNHSSLSARRNHHTALAELKEDLRNLESHP
ncbi:MAG: type II secretion system protein [Gimesia sp.]